MITIICGTNRTDNNTKIFARHYEKLLKSMTDEPVEVLELEKLSENFVFKNEVYGNASPEFTDAVERKIERATKLIIVSPEYNGGFPGVLKAFIDAVKPTRFYGKKTALIGISSGRSGNARGMDQLTNVCLYLKMPVMPYKCAITHIEKLIENDRLTDEKTIAKLTDHAGQLLRF